MNGNSFSSISRRIKVANEIRWEIVIINMGIIFNCIKKSPAYEQYAEAMAYHMHQTVDRFNPTLGFAPSTYFTTAAKRHIWKCQNGNANQKNMNYIMASEMGSELKDVSFQSVFDAKVADVRSSPVEDEILHLENVERITVLMDSLPEDRDREVIKMRYFSAMNLQEIADVLQISRERVRQLEIRALGRMRFTANRALSHFALKNHQPLPLNLPVHPDHQVRS